MDKKSWIYPHPLPIPPPSTPRTPAFPPPSTSISPPQRVSMAPFSDTQTPQPEPEISTPHPSSSVAITLKQVKELVSLFSETLTSQLQNIQSQNNELKNEMQGLKTQNL